MVYSDLRLPGNSVHFSPCDPSLEKLEGMTVLCVCVCVRARARAHYINVLKNNALCVTKGARLTVTFCSIYTGGVLSPRLLSR